MSELDPAAIRDHEMRKVVPDLEKIDLCDALTAARGERGQWNTMLNTEGDRMSEVDTTAIRAAARGNTYRYLAGIVTVLCDALEAARAGAAEAEVERRDWMVTEQPDTTAIRHVGWATQTVWCAMVRDLCDAVDQLRAQAALDIAYVDVLLAKISELTERAETAEARIAAALAALDDLGGVARKAEVFTALHHVRRALTGQ